MRPSRRFILLAGSIVLLSATQSVGQQVCKPYLSFQEVRFSDVQNQKRKWTAVLSVDASRCAATSGRFDIKFIRLKETAPDLEFSEQFMWGPGQVEVSADFWQDEAVLKYSIDSIASCVCRD
jgi:hypothetical protein